MLKFLLLAVVVFLLPAADSSFADETSRSKYEGQQSREIKNLSRDDIDELRRGGGWGLARAAELNGIPGPVHLLELKSEINLSAKQVEAITKVYKSMRDAAIQKGEKLIELERQLEMAFVNSNLDEIRLREILKAIAEVRSDLRFIHLSTHLKTPPILLPSQIDKYNILRGYRGDPCKSIPKNHDSTMWRKHNGCS